MEEEEEEEEDVTPKRSSRGQSRRQKRATPQQTKGRSTSRSKRAKAEEEEEEEEEPNEEDVTPKGRRSSRGKASEKAGSGDTPARGRRGRQQVNKKEEPAVETKPRGRGRRRGAAEAEEEPSPQVETEVEKKEEEEEEEEKPTEEAAEAEEDEKGVDEADKGPEPEKEEVEETQEKSEEIQKTDVTEEPEVVEKERLASDTEAEKTEEVAVEEAKPGEPMKAEEPKVSEEEPASAVEEKSEEQEESEKEEDEAPMEEEKEEKAPVVEEPSKPEPEEEQMPEEDEKEIVQLGSRPSELPETAMETDDITEAPQEPVADNSKVNEAEVNRAEVSDEQEKLSVPVAEPELSANGSEAMDTADAPEPSPPQQGLKRKLDEEVVAEAEELVAKRARVNGEDSLNEESKKQMPVTEDVISIQKEAPVVTAAPTEEPKPPSSEKEENVANDFVVVNKEDVPAPDSQEVKAALPQVSASPAKEVPATEPVAAAEPDIAPKHSAAMDVDTKMQPAVPSATPAVPAESSFDIPAVAAPTQAESASSVTAPAESQSSQSSEAAVQPPQQSAPATSDNSEVAPNSVNLATSNLVVPPPAVLPNADSMGQTASQEVPVSQDVIFTRKYVPNPARSAADPAHMFAVVSYNILANCHIYPKEYTYTPPEYLDQEYRHRLLIEELTYLKGDIICLQEVAPEYFSTKLLPALQRLGYEGTMFKRTKEHFNEGEATFYKTSRFALEDYQGLSLSDLADKEIEAGGLSNELRTAARQYLDRADVVLITRLRCKITNRIVTIGNIHVVWDFFRCRDVQCIQVACAIKEVVNRAGSDSAPHIICGDFNSEVTSPAYQLACDGYLVDNSIQKLQAIENLHVPDGKKSLLNTLWRAFQHTSTNLKSAYATTMGTEPTLTSLTSFMKAAVDYVFFSAASLDNTGVLQTADPAAMEATVGLPNKVFPSDHVSMKALFAFRD